MTRGGAVLWIQEVFVTLSGNGVWGGRPVRMARWESVWGHVGRGWGRCGPERGPGESGRVKTRRVTERGVGDRRGDGSVDWTQGVSRTWGVGTVKVESQVYEGVTGNRRSLFGHD